MLGGVAREDRGENEDRNFSRAGLKIENEIEKQINEEVDDFPNFSNLFKGKGRN
jgi:hypothetical protein